LPLSWKITSHHTTRARNAVWIVINDQREKKWREPRNIGITCLLIYPTITKRPHLKIEGNNKLKDLCSRMVCSFNGGLYLELTLWFHRSTINKGRNA
jgi:hypothetical protein